MLGATQGQTAREAGWEMARIKHQIRGARGRLGEYPAVLLTSLAEEWALCHGLEHAGAMTRMAEEECRDRLAAGIEDQELDSESAPVPLRLLRRLYGRFNPRVKNRVDRMHFGQSRTQGSSGRAQELRPLVAELDLTAVADRYLLGALLDNAVLMQVFKARCHEDEEFLRACLTLDPSVEYAVIRSVLPDRADFVIRLLRARSSQAKVLLDPAAHAYRHDLTMAIWIGLGGGGVDALVGDLLEEDGGRECVYEVLDTMHQLGRDSRTAVIDRDDALALVGHSSVRDLEDLDQVLSVVGKVRQAIDAMPRDPDRLRAYRDRAGSGVVAGLAWRALLEHHDLLAKAGVVCSLDAVLWADTRVWLAYRSPELHLPEARLSPGLGSTAASVTHESGYVPLFEGRSFVDGGNAARAEQARRAGMRKRKR